MEYKGQTLYAVTSYLKIPDENDGKETTPETTKPGSIAGITFQEANEQVTAKIETNLRTEPSSQSSDTVVVTLKNGEWVTRTGIGDNGWSRVEYNGQTLYAITSYLTTDKNYKPTQPVTQPDVVYTDVKEQVTPKIEVNLRTEASSDKGDATIVALVKNGEVLTRTGIGSNGWSRLEYNGQTVYAVTSLLQSVEGE